MDLCQRSSQIIPMTKFWSIEHVLDLNAVYMFIELKWLFWQQLCKQTCKFCFFFAFGALWWKGTRSDSFIHVHETHSNRFHRWNVQVWHLSNKQGWRCEIVTVTSSKQDINNLLTTKSFSTQWLCSHDRVGFLFFSTRLKVYKSHVWQVMA